MWSYGDHRPESGSVVGSQTRLLGGRSENAEVARLGSQDCSQEFCFLQNLWGFGSFTARRWWRRRSEHTGWWGRCRLGVDDGEASVDVELSFKVDDAVVKSSEPGLEVVKVLGDEFCLGLFVEQFFLNFPQSLTVW